MKPRPFDYVRPDTVDEAVAILAEHGDDARVLAGGQTLLAMLNLRVVRARHAGRHHPIAELDAIREVDGKVEVGATVTQNKLMSWPALAMKLPLLAAALLRRPLPDPQQGYGLWLDCAPIGVGIAAFSCRA
jgi:2-furoyl-CoA dehydrogenase FAD binding subunit